MHRAARMSIRFAGATVLSAVVLAAVAGGVAGAQPAAPPEPATGSRAPATDGAESPAPRTEPTAPNTEPTAPAAGSPARAAEPTTPAAGSPPPAAEPTTPAAEPTTPAARSPARADEPTAPAARSATPGPAAPSPKRAWPDYDGRGSPDADADHWALWIPRALLAPLYVINEYVLRWPLGTLISRAERDRWINTLAELFSFGPNRQFMLIPTAVYDFGFRTNVGLRFTADHLIVRNHDFIAHAATGGTDWLIASVRDRYRWDHGRTAVATHFDLVRRPDLVFRRIGPDAKGTDGLRYGLQKLDAGAWFTHRAGGGQLLVAAGVRRLAFRSPECCHEPTIDSAIQAGEIDAPPGYGTPYTVAYQTLSLTADTRTPRPAPGTGARIAAYATTSFDPGHDHSWIRYGGALGGALDVTGKQRTLRLQVATDLIDPMQGDIVPFTDLVSMEDQNQMQGFPGGWMIGRSTIAAELGYSWPVAFLLDGNARLSVGNAFGAHFDGFAADQLRMSADIGVTTIGARDSGFELIFGVGTSTFERGAGIDSVRFAVGSRRGI